MGKKELVEDEIMQIKKCLKEFHSGVISKEILGYNESHGKIMLGIERQHVRNMLNEQICGENKNKLLEFNPRYEKIQKDLKKIERRNEYYCQKKPKNAKISYKKTSKFKRLKF